MAQLAEITADFATARELELHGHRVTYRTAGSGPVVLLVHGIAGSSEKWGDMAPILAERYTVIAPDLLGHGAVRQAARRLLARRLRERRARPPDRPRPRARHGRRPLARRRHRDAVRLPVPRALRAARRSSRAAASAARCTRCCAPRRCRAPSSSCRCSLASAVLGLGGAAGRIPRAASGCAPARTSPRSPAASRRSPTPRPAGAFLHTVRAVIDPDGQRVSAADRLYLAEHAARR